MKKFYLVGIVMMLFCSLNSIAQEKIDPSTAFDDGNIYFHNALAFCKYNLAKDVYCKESADFFDEALTYYMVALEQNPENAELNFKIGVCLYANNRSDEAVKYFEKAGSIDPSVDGQYEFYLALSYKFSYDWQKAIEHFTSVIENQKSGKIAKKSSIDESVLQRHIAECRRADSIQNVESLEVVNMGDLINSKYADYNVVSSATGTSFLFSSRQPDYRLMEAGEDTLDFEANSENLFENIYTAYCKDVKSGTWAKAHRMGDMLVVAGENYAILDISEDGEHCLAYRSDNGGDIYEGLFEDGDWKGMWKLEGINSNYYEPTAVYAKDGIYLVSNRNGGKGGKDIYFSARNENGSYSKPENLGAVINTAGDEDGLCLINDTILFFGSDGRNGLGGYDIYKTVKANGVWGEPELLPFPINTPYNDVFFTLNDYAYDVIFNNKKHPNNPAWAYIASDRHGSFGKLDIFRINKTDNEQAVAVANADAPKVFENTKVEELTVSKAVRKMPTSRPSKAVFAAEILDCENGNHVENATVVIADTMHNILAKPVVVNGYFSAEIKSEEVSQIIIEAPNYYYQTQIVAPLAGMTYTETECLYRQDSKLQGPSLSEKSAEPYIRNVVYEGKIIEYLVKNPIPAKLEFYNLEDSVAFATTTCDSQGRFSISLPADKYYRMIVVADGYLRQTTFINSLSDTDKEFLQVEVLRKSDGFVKNNLDEMLSHRQLQKFATLEISLTDQTTGKSVDGSAEIFALSEQNKIKSIKSKNGKIFLAVAPENKYRIAIVVPDYALQIVEVTIPEKENFNALNIEFVPNNKNLISSANTQNSEFAQNANNLSMRNIIFKSSKFDVDKEYVEELKAFANQIAKNKNIKIEVSGHADCTGPDALNMRLSVKRANAVADLLKKYGVAESQIKVVGKGETEPISTNNTLEGRRLNRRVEIKILK